MIKNFFILNKKPILLFLLMFILELIMIFTLWQKNDLNIFFRSDGTEYQRLVMNIVNHKAFSVEKGEPFIPTDYRTPGYPVFLVFIYLIFRSFRPAIFIGATIFAVSAPLVYLIGRQIFSEKIAFISAFVFALELWAIFQSGFLAAEQIFLPFLLFSIYLFCRYLKSENNTYLYWASLFLGLTILIRPVALYFIFVFAIFAFIFELKHSILRSFKVLVVTILILIAVLSPWLIRNKIVLNTWQISSAASNGVLYIESWALNKYLGKIGDEHEWERAAILLGTRDYESMKHPDKAKILAEYAIKEIKANKTAFVAMHLKSMAVFFVKNSYGNIFFDLKIKGANVQSQMGSLIFKKDLFGLFNLIKNTAVGSKILILLFFFWPIIIILTIFGVFYMARSNWRNLLFWLLIFWILYFPALTSDLLDESRYKLAINAPLLMLAVYGFYKIKNLLTFDSKNDYNTHQH